MYPNFRGNTGIPYSRKKFTIFVDQKEAKKNLGGHSVETSTLENFAPRKVLLSKQGFAP